MNAGEVLFALFVTLGVYPLIWGLSKCKYEKVKNKCTGMLEEYKYGVFIRYWIQSYLDLGMASAIQIVYLPSTHFVPILAYVLACVFGVLVLGTPPLVLMFLRKHSTEIKTSSEDSYFYKAYGSFFYEFKTEGSFAKYTYLVFFCKRLAFGLSLVFLKDLPIFQGFVNSLLMLGYFLFTVIVKPHSETITQVVNSVVELGVTLVFSGTAYFLQAEVTEHDELIEGIIFYAVMGLVLVQSLGSVLSFGVAAYKFLKEKCSRNKVSPNNVDEVVVLNAGHDEFSPGNQDEELTVLSFFVKSKDATDDGNK